MKYLFFICVIGLVTGSINGKFYEFKLCHSAKHCIKCSQHNLAFGKYYTVPDQDTYSKSLIEKFNDFRSWYAKEFEIGNMRFAKWNFEFYSLAENTATMVGNADLSCSPPNNSTSVAQRVHNIADFSTSVKTKLDENGTNHAVFEKQFNALINQAINSTHLVKYNVNEFGCCYSFKSLVNRTVFLLRCMFYADQVIGSGEIISPTQCSNCTEAESCIRVKYPGLCVPTNSTEKYVRKLLHPDPSDSYTGASMAVYIKLYLFVTTILVILCEILLINKI